MGKIKFVSSHYWKKATMQLGDRVTDEQWAEVQAVCDQLNTKYQFEEGCNIHPDKVQKLLVGLFNDHVDIQILKADTCMCHEIVDKLWAIRNDETALLNAK